MREPGWPKLAFIEHRVAGDPTNWWAANHAAVEALLRSCGLRVAARPAHEIYLCEPNREAPGELDEYLQREYLAAIGQSSTVQALRAERHSGLV
jgi:tRNA (mo5U34)-methyltransferase